MSLRAWGSDVDHVGVVLPAGHVVGHDLKSTLSLMPASFVRAQYVPALHWKVSPGDRGSLWPWPWQVKPVYLLEP